MGFDPDHAPAVLTPLILLINSDIITHVKTPVQIRIGTRGSHLARAQSRIVADAIMESRDGVEVEFDVIVTRGDKLAGPLADAGGKGLFTAELEDAMRDGRIDLAVHSAKDMPITLGDGTVIAGVPARQDPRDALVSPKGLTLEQMPPCFTVGTGSPRRSALVKSSRDDAKVVGIRGNVETRLARTLDGGEDALDAVIVAMAGLIRSSLAEKHSRCICPLDAGEFIPAAGQGLLAIQCSETNHKTLELISGIDHAPSHKILDAERLVLAGLEANCHSAVAVYITETQGSAMAARVDGSDMIRVEAAGKSPQETAELLLDKLFKANVRNILHGDKC